jgi:hypothetical protein
MSDERIQTHRTATDAGLKFDYWMASLAGAVLAYSVQHYAPRRFISTASLLEPCALLLFTIAFYFSYRRIECEYQHAHLNHRLLENDEYIDAAHKAIQGYHGGPLFEKYTGASLTLEQLKQNTEKRQQENRETTAKMLARERKGEFAYQMRFVFLTAGFVFLLVAKIIQPYLR